MKKLVYLSLFFSLSILMPFNSFAETLTDDEPLTTEPSIEETEPSTANQTITLKYLDVDTHEEIAPASLLTGNLGEAISLTIKKIAGYELSDVVLTNELTFLKTNYEFPIHYVKLPQESSASSSPINEPTLPTDTTETTDSQAITSEPSNSDTPKESTTPSSKKRQNTSTTSTIEEGTTSSTPLTNEGTANSTQKGVIALEPSARKTKADQLLPKAGEQNKQYLPMIGLGLISLVVGYQRKYS